MLLAIDGLPIASDGMVELEGERVLMAEVAERKFLGDAIKFSIVREKKPMDVTVKFYRAWPFQLQANGLRSATALCAASAVCSSSRFRAICSGAYQFDNPRINYYYDYFITKELYKEHPEVIVLSAILPDPINTYLGEFREGIVDEINGHKIKTLEDVATAFGGRRPSSTS